MVMFFCFLCLLTMFYEVAPFMEPSNDNDNEEESVGSVIKSILGSEFEGYNGSFPLINTPIEIELGTRFYSMEIAVHFIEQYALQNNFAIFKHKSEKFLDGTDRKRVFKCDMGGRYIERLTKPTLGKERGKGSKKQGCMWQININRRVNTPIVTVTSFKNEHNHKISIDTVNFATSYKSFSEEIMEQIEFYVVHDRCDAGTIRNLLQLQANDPAWFVKPLIDDTSNRLIGIFWMSPEQRERWSKFYDVIIHDNTARTNKYNYPLSLFILIDNSHWKCHMQIIFILDKFCVTLIMLFR